MAEVLPEWLRYCQNVFHYLTHVSENTAQDKKNGTYTLSTRCPLVLSIKASFKN